MCLAPCFAGCTKEEYDAEANLVVEALATAGDALKTKLEAEREAASAALDFERAAALHNRVDKVSAALRGLPEIARRIDTIDAIILQRAAEEKTIVLFPIRAALLGEPIFLRFAELSSQPRSAEALLREELERASDCATREAPAEASADAEAQREDYRECYGLRAAPPELPEHLSLVARWFYSKPREGEILFRDADWPYRRILRACNRLLAPAAVSQANAPPLPRT